MRRARRGMGLEALSLAVLLHAGAAEASHSAAPGPAPAETAAAVAAPDFREDEFDSLDILGAAAKLRPRIRLLQDFTFRQPYDDARVDTYRTDLRASVSAPVTEAIALRFSAGFAVSHPVFHGDRDFLDTGRRRGDPFDDLLDNRFRLEGRYLFDESWALLGSVQMHSSWESGASWESGLQGSGILAVGYLWDDRVSVVAGVRLGSRVAASGAKVRPVLQVAWRVTDALEIETRNLGLRVSYRLGPDLKLFAWSEWSQRGWRLQDRGGEVGRGLLQSRRVPAVAGITWKLAKRWRLRAHAGAIAYQRYTVRDSDRDRTDRTTSDGAAFTGRVDLRFRF